jgi:type II secretory pathway pseudopilin PulG
MQSPRNHPERGFILLALLFMVAVILIVMATAAPAIGTQIKRDREDELMRRGKQYRRAIQLYYRKFGRFPGSLDELKSTNNIRFLRKKYTDPITGTDEWRIIRFGQAKPRTVPSYLSGDRAGTGTGVGGGTSQGTLPGQSAQSISRPLSGSQSMGGGPIVGVSSLSEKESLKELDGKNHYHEWEFVYDPSLDPGARQQPGNQGDRGQRPPRSPGQTSPVPSPGPGPRPQ